MSYIDEYMIEAHQRLEKLEELYIGSFEQSNWRDCLYVIRRMDEILEAMTMGDMDTISNELQASLIEIGEDDEDE